MSLTNLPCYLRAPTYPLQACVALSCPAAPFAPHYLPFTCLPGNRCYCVAYPVGYLRYPSLPSDIMGILKHRKVKKMQTKVKKIIGVLLTILFLHVLLFIYLFLFFYFCQNHLIVTSDVIICTE